MEHVDDLAGAYAATRQWLRSGGVFSHWVDFKSHGHSKYWNGHWAFSDFDWRLRRGRKVFLLNRHHLSKHLEYVKQAGFLDVAVSVRHRSDGISRSRLATRFSGMSDTDLTTSGAEITGCKEE
jgi:hypothetical protein